METLVLLGVGIAVVVWLFGDRGGGSGGYRRSGNHRCRCRLYSKNGMDLLLSSALTLYLAYYMYHEGKRLGSRLGFRGGHRRRRLRSRSARRFLR